jgi:tripartite ATP-independent transporter DctM subunit
LDKRGYDKKLNLGTLAAGGALGLLIPPSTTFLIYGAITGTSVAKLFIAGIIPGLVAVAIFMIYIIVRIKLNPSLVPELPPKSTLAEKGRGLIDMLPFLALMVMIMLSIYMGWATPTEAAAFSAFMAIVFAVIYKEFTFARLVESGIKTVKATAMIFFIIIGAQIFSSLITQSGISRGLLRWFTGSGFDPLLFFLVVCLIYLVLGCLMDGTSVTYFTLPLLFPLVEAVGYDPIWFGVIVAVLIEVGMITPPVGMNLFVLLGITGDRASFKDVCMGSLPFVFLYLLLVAILYLAPSLATWLPASM